MLYPSNTDVQAVLDMRRCLDALRVGYADLARIDAWCPTGRGDEHAINGSC